MPEPKGKSGIGIELAGDRINLVRLRKTSKGIELTEARSIKLPVSKKAKGKTPLIDTLTQVFEGLELDSEFYFVHSYYPSPIEPDQILGETTYGITFTSVLMKKNLVAMQFHPEKSGKPGLKILENFCKWNGEYNAE